MKTKFDLKKKKKEKLAVTRWSKTTVDSLTSDFT